MTAGPAEVYRQLLDHNATIAIAESLTGGLLTAALTDTPGSSAVVRGGLVVYATALKATLAGVDPLLLAQRGAVDPDVARQLAVGVRHRLGATVGVGVTGVAGPDPQDGAEVGTVFGAIAGPHAVQMARWQFTGDRAAIRAATVAACLELISAELGGVL